MATNIVPATWFTGWDNLHPEFNIALNFKRALFGLWQEHQGLGHIGGHGYGATLPHTLITGFLSLALPVNQIRITFIFLALLAGAIGCYALIVHLLKEKATKFTPWIALIGSLFYLLNYGTVQQFYTPLEAFVVHFATLPWLLFLALRLMHRWTKRVFLLFLLVSLLSTVQGFIPPLFIAYSLTLGLILLFSLMLQRTWTMTKHVLLIIFATICINAYWILPVAHFTLTAQNTYLNANNNILSTQSWIETNQTYGSIKNLAVLRGFLSQAVNDVEGTQIPIFKPWEDHLKQIPIQIIGYVVFGMMCLGVAGFALSKRKKPELALAVVGILTFSILASDIPGLSVFSHTLDSLPLFRQAFRAGFTKLSILLALHYSIFLAFGAYTIISLTHRFRIILLISIGVSIILFSLPAFRGHFLYQRAHLAIPTAYQDTFAFFQKQESAGRILLLPQGDHWGWEVYRWGYSGSGFLWFGLPQPILARAFDVWSNFNENYYWELSYALYSHNATLLNNVLEKYEIDWVIFDTSLIPYPHPHAGFATDDIGKLIAEIPSLSRINTLPIGNKQGDEIRIYKVNREHIRHSFIKIAQAIPSDVSSYEWSNQDKAFELLGLYKKADGVQTGEGLHVYFPFRSLFSGRPYQQEPFETSVEKGQITIKTKIPQTFSGGTLLLPVSLLKMKNLLPTITIDGKSLIIPTATISASIHINEIQNGIFSFIFPKTSTTVMYDSQLIQDVSPEIKRCDANKTKGISEYETFMANGSSKYRLSNSSSSSCFDLFLASLSQKEGYILSIQSKHINGSPLTLQVINGTSQRTDITKLLSQSTEETSTTIIIPPMQTDGIGYSIRLANDAITDNPTINEIGDVKLIAFPWYDFLTSLYLEKGQQTETAPQENIISVSHPNPAYYKIGLKTEDIRNKTLILNQAFDPGWKAYEVQCQMPNFQCQIKKALPFLFGKEIKEHVMVNNWANGWEVNKVTKQQSDNTTIILFFLPQLLEWMGFLLLPVPFLLLILKRFQK